MTGADSTAGGCPRHNEHCGYARGEHYCSLWDTCADLAEMSRQLQALKQAQAEELPEGREGIGGQ